MDEATTERLLRLLLRPKEVVIALGLSRSTVYALIASGSIESIRIGRCVRVPADALQSWIERQRNDELAK